MRVGVPFVPIVVVAALLILPSGQASHLSMDMPGLGGAALPPPSFALLVVTTLAALLQGGWLVVGRAGARDAGWAFALSPLAVAAACASSLAPTGDLGARIASVGTAGSEHMWALLATLALAVGFGAARTLELADTGGSRDGEDGARFVRGAAALVLASPFVALILATSTGVDAISAWIRWGGCGLAVIVCAAGALVPGRGEARAVGGVTFSLAVVFGLLAQREYVEALGHAALVHRDPFDPAVEWARGLREIAVAVEPRERYGPLLALLPWIALVPATSWRAARPRFAMGLAVLASGVVLATMISSRLDASALAAAPPPTAVALEPPEIRWSARVLPRTAPWLRAMRPASAPEPAPSESPPPVQCAAWTVTAPADG